MVPVGSGFFSRVESFAASLPFAGEWILALAGLIQGISPHAYLFRTDWRRAQMRWQQPPTAASSAEPDDAAPVAYIVACLPAALPWPPRGAGGRYPRDSKVPRGLGIGVDRAGRLNPRQILHFRSSVLGQCSGSEPLSALAVATGLAPEMIPTVSADQHHLYTAGLPIIVGLDSEESSRGPGPKV